MIDLSPIRAVIFDFDGVIADTERLHFGAFRDVFQERGWSLDEAAYFDRYLGYDDRGLVVAYARDERIPIDEAMADAILAAKASNFARYLNSADILYPSARSCVVELARHFPLGIASGALHHEIETILRATALLDFFPVIVGADDVVHSKPSPETYSTAAARIGVEPSACVAIEDSAGGLAAAIAAGMRTVAITTTSPRGALTAANRIIDELAEFSPDLVRSLGGPQAL